MKNKNAYYGFFAGTVSAALLQPLDNIKIALIVPPTKLTLTSNWLANAYRVARYILEEEGWRAFYKGLAINTIKTGLSSCFYFYFLRFNEKFLSEGNLTKFLASAGARIISATISSPLSVIETRYELACTEKWSGSIIKSLRRVYQKEGVQGFFKGYVPTCWK
jgi:hypothetical protein